MVQGFAEYIWLDGARPTATLRSKTRVIQFSTTPKLEDFPEWGFDGSSTHQSSGLSSDLILNPCRVYPDPIRGENCYLVLCEVTDKDGIAHPSNTRAITRQVIDAVGDVKPWMGFEQEYTIMDGSSPAGWPKQGFPRPQGPYYCGVGFERVNGRNLVEAHAVACLEAGLALYGTNAEVMLGQWEFQIGHRGFENEEIDALRACDDLWVGRWLLERLSEDYGVTVSFVNKPVRGDWNGSGCHTNFSTEAMRQAGGIKYINAAIEALAKEHANHVKVYGHGLAERLTGLHETCNINEFRSGVSDRGASIRIPLSVEKSGHGYLEDRRPGANCDPYVVAARLIATVCDSQGTLWDDNTKHIESLNVA